MFDRLDWYLKREPWRLEPATEQQYRLLESLGFSGKPATKGEASDEISRRSEPDEYELEFLHRQGVDARRMSQYEAIEAIARIITDPVQRTKWEASPKPLFKRDVKRGDRVVLQREDNSTWRGELTATSGRLLKVRPIAEDGTLGEAVEVHSSALLAREGDNPFKHYGNLIPGDLIYSAKHKSGLQYGKIIRGSRHDRVTCVRYVEAKSQWTKNPTELYSADDLDVLGHESDPEALKAFFDRIEKDRAMWQASPGRSGFKKIPGQPNAYGWNQKERVWAGEDKPPVQHSSQYRSTFEPPSFRETEYHPPKPQGAPQGLFARLRRLLGG